MPEPDKVAEVARLATAIARRILEQNAAGTTIPPEQFTMLVKAAQMLLDQGAPWPLPVEDVLMEVAKRLDPARPVSDYAANADPGGIMHLNRPLDSGKYWSNADN